MDDNPPSHELGRPIKLERLFESGSIPHPAFTIPCIP